MVEDDAISRLSSVMILKEVGIADNFEFVNDGLEAIEYLHEHRSKLNNDNHNSMLMILDLNMPIYDGFDVLRYLKMNNVINLKNVEIMILSSSISATDKATAFRYNVSAFIEKPLSRQKLVEVGLIEAV